MPGQRQHDRQVTALAGKATGHMHQRLQQANLLLHLMLAAQLVDEVIQLGLPLTHQPRQGNGGAHIGERIVGLAMLQTIGLGQQLQTQTDAAIDLGPLDTLGAKRIGTAQQIDQIPAAVTTLPLSSIRIVEVAIEAVTRHLIIKAQAVVTGRAGSRHRHLGMQTGHELSLRQAALGNHLRADPGDQAGLRMGQDVWR